MLIIEVEGSAAEQDELLRQISAICRDFDPISLRVSQSAEESLAIWKGRKGAFGAVGRICPDYLCMDGTIPTSRLPEVLRRIGEMGEACSLQVANIFHAGDGNLHPLIMFDANDADSFARAEKFGADILRLCVEVGGCLTGEHGVGRRKARSDGRAVQHGRSRSAAADQIGFRSGLAAQPEQGVSPATPRGDRRRMTAAPAPDSEAAIAGEIRAAYERREPLLLCGNGTKAGMLRPVQAARTLSLRGYAGITFYSPKELVITARAGTTLAESVRGCYRRAPVYRLGTT